jgi:hypothetical protein
MRRHILFLFILFIICCRVNCQQEVAVIAFWNVENLFDTIDDPLTQDNEFTPQGALAWTGERYRQKLTNLAEAISRIGNDITLDGAALFGLCEVENLAVLEDLVNMPSIKDRGYRSVLIEGPDKRGIDPALLYNPSYFKIEKTKSLRVDLADTSHRTRDVLLVYGELIGEPVAIFVNHWPSRRGGEKTSRPSRITAAGVVRKAVDSLRQAEPGRKIIIVGDFNDDPVSYSVKEILCSDEKKEGLGENCFYNPMTALYKKGVGTLAWNDRWNLFDQVLLSKEWLGASGWNYSEARVFNRHFLCSQEGNYKGYPLRTYSAGVYTGGYSDHFPSYIIVTRDGK